MRAWCDILILLKMSTNNQKTYTFHISGLRCDSCVLTTESSVCSIPYVTNAQTNIKKQLLEVSGDFGDKTEDEIAKELTLTLQEHGYTVATEKVVPEKDYSDFKVAVPVAIAFAGVFILLQKLGLVNLVDSGEISYGTVFVIGIIASLSTCMAIVGGLLLSMSATFAKEGATLQPQILFHVGRIASFFILGGVIGSMGAIFTLSTTVTIILSVIIGLVMIILGLNLLDIFHFTKYLQPSMPKFLSKHALGVSKFNHTMTPLLVGIATFFLPCGFTQSMQLYTLSTGSFMNGGLTMLSFALGTFPVLALISFGSASVQKYLHKGIFFKTAGLIVIMFAVLNLINSLVVAGLISPIFDF